MKRSIAIALALGLLAGAFVGPAEAAKKKKKRKPKKVTREVEGSYDLPPLVIAGTCAQTGAVGCVLFVTGADEKYVTAEVTDDHGQPVTVSIQADTDPAVPGDDTIYGEFCGKTEEPIEVPPGQELHFWVGAVTDVGPGCVPGMASSGTVSAVFSNLP